MRTLVAEGAARNREYFVWLPKNYDASRAYPTIFLWGGCGSKGNQGVPLQTATGEDAILVGGSPAGECFDDQPANSREYPFFDQMLKEVSAAFCVDRARLFTVGYSSGGWIAHGLGCARAGVLRAYANVSGGTPGRNTCPGPIAAMMLHDRDDNYNIGGDPLSGSITSRNRLITANGCQNTTVKVDPAPCVAYQGCKAGYPLLWCETMGFKHDRRDDFAPREFWKFFSQF